MKNWIKKEITQAIELLKSGNTYEEISIILNRTKKSIKCKLHREGYFFVNYDKLLKTEKVICLECEKEFIFLKSANRKFCSSSCAISYYNKINKLKHGLYTKDRKSVKHCEICEQEIVKNVRLKSRFCSHECQQKFRKNEKEKEILNGSVKYIKTLKKYIINRDGKKCKICGISEWKGKNILLVLDHVDGDSNNNFPSNLRLLCPNCDAQTDTFAGKNIGNGRKKRRDRYYKEKMILEELKTE
jgi:hypothetical protein